jgi:hypothetical protein
MMHGRDDVCFRARETVAFTTDMKAQSRAIETLERRFEKVRGPAGPFPFQISECSASATASSLSTPRYLTTF